MDAESGKQVCIQVGSDQLDPAGYVAELWTGIEEDVGRGFSLEAAAKAALANAYGAGVASLEVELQRALRRHEVTIEVPLARERGRTASDYEPDGPSR